MKKLNNWFKKSDMPENELINEDEKAAEHEKDAESGAELNDAAQENNAKRAEKSNAPEDRIKDLEAKVAEANDKFLRLYSEFDNFRKRNARERIDLVKTAGEDIFKVFLPVIDDFDRAIKANENVTDVAPVKEVVQLIYNKMKHQLTQKGLEVMESIGKDFDSYIMEAITRIPAPSPELKGKVVDEVEKGYTLNGKVIRFSKVIVGD